MNSSQPDHGQQKALGGPVRDPLNAAIQWHQSGSKVVLATVIETWGSSPCPPGSQLAVSQSGDMVGSVSAGCVESAVVESALGLMSERDPLQLEFGVNDEMAWEVGLACGGRIRVFLEIIDDKFAAYLEMRATALDNRQVSIGLTWLDGTQRDFHTAENLSAPSPILQAQAVQAIERDQAAVVDLDGTSIFLHPFIPAPRLLIIGAVHIAQSLANLASHAGFQITVIDPRRAFATRERFPNVTLSHDWPDDAIQRHAPDSRTAIVTLSHDPKLDDPALERALESPAFYIGSLGSKRTHAKRLERLRQLGITEEQIARIHGPVGLDIGARTPSEIAVSILAETVKQLRRPS